MRKAFQQNGEGPKINLGPLAFAFHFDFYYAENDVPQPQPPVALGFSKVKPEPIMFVV